MFLYQRWIQKTLNNYVTGQIPPKLKGRTIVMSPLQYGAVLMQAYFGKASLEWISEITGVTIECLRNWRSEIRFLMAMDWCKSVFSEYFQETLISNDYTVVEYHEIAAEFALLEDSLQVAVRAQLYKRLKNLREKLSKQNQHGIKIENYDLYLFRRLFLFFLALEYHQPSPAVTRIQNQLLPLAKDVVWPSLGCEEWVESELKSAQEERPLPQLRLQLADMLKVIFDNLA